VRFGGGHGGPACLRADRFDAGLAALRDSCADPGSPLFEELWPDRIPIGTLVLPSGPTARAALAPLARSRRRLRSAPPAPRRRSGTGVP